MLSIKEDIWTTRVSKQLMVPIDFYSIGGDWKLLGNSILQIIFLCIQQKKETHTGVNDERIVMFGWIIFLYCFLCCCTLTQFFFFFLLLESGLSMLEPRLEWLVALVMLGALSDECCLRMRRSGCAPGLNHYCLINRQRFDWRQVCHWVFKPQN